MPILITLPACLAAAGLPAGPPHAPHSLSQEKDTRTAAQRKIDSQLLYEIYRSRGQAEEKHVPPGPTGVKLDKKGRALVDVRVEVTSQMQALIRSVGGTIVDTSGEYRSIIAWVPLSKLERLAGDPAVHSIHPAPEATTIKHP